MDDLGGQLAVVVCRCTTGFNLEKKSSIILLIVTDNCVDILNILFQIELSLSCESY